MHCFTIALLIFLCSCSQAKQTLLAQRALCVPIGLNGEQIDLCVLNTQNHHYSNPHNRYFLVDEVRIYDVPGLGNEFQTYNLLVSPSRRFMAVEVDVGRGYGTLFVTDLNGVRAGLKPAICGRVETTLKGFSNLKWQGEILTFETEKELPPKPAEHPVKDFTVYRYQISPEKNCRLEQVDN